MNYRSGKHHRVLSRISELQKLRQQTREIGEAIEQERLSMFSDQAPEHYSHDWVEN